jgi:hypothetical protein
MLFLLGATRSKGRTMLSRFSSSCKLQPDIHDFSTYTRAAKPMARLPEVACEVFFACGFYCVPLFYRPTLPYYNEGVGVVYDYHLLPNDAASE